MEEATMSQHAELTATDSLVAADLSETPTQNTKKPARFSADAFRALSSRLNTSPTPDLTAQPPVAQPVPAVQPDCNGQTIPEIQIDPSDTPAVEPPVQPNPTIAVPIDGIVNGAEPVVAEVPPPTAVPAPLAPVTPAPAVSVINESVAPVANEPAVAETLDGAQIPPLNVEPAQKVDQAPITATVPSIDEHVANSIPQFDVPQIEIPTISAPDISATAHQDDLTQSEPTSASPLHGLSEHGLSEHGLPDADTVEHVPLANQAEPEFLDLAQFTHDDSSAYLVSTQLPIPPTDAPDQVLPEIEPIAEESPSPSTNVGSLSLAEMLAAEPQAIATEQNVDEQATPVVEPAVSLEPVPSPSVVEPGQETVETNGDDTAVQFAQADPQIEVNPTELSHTEVTHTEPNPIDVSDTIEPSVQSLATPIDIVQQAVPAVQAEPSLDDLFVQQPSQENQQPAFQISTTAQSPAMPITPQEMQSEQPIVVEPQIEPQAPTPAVQETVQETVPVSLPKIEPQPIPAQTPDTALLDVDASDSDPSLQEFQVTVQPEPVLENETEVAQPDVEPLAASQVEIDTPSLEADPAQAVSFSPQSGVDPLLEAMRLMQEVGPTPVPDSIPAQEKPATEIANKASSEASSVEATDQVQDHVPEQGDKQADVSARANEDDVERATTTSNEVVAQTPSNVSAETAPAAPVEQPETDIDPDYELELEPDEKSGETARALLDMMSGAGGAAQPQERALAGDTLLQLVPRMPERDLISLSERVGMMDEPPALLVNKLINNRSARVAQPLLEGGQVVSDQDLLKLIKKCEVDRLTMISKRRQISSGVCDALIARGDASVYLTLVRNPGALISHDAFIILCEIAKNQQTLQAPLATRGDTPPPIAFELFWSLPVELRRYVLSRFLTDSATLDKILKIAQSMDSDSGVEAAGDQHFPTRRKVDELVDLIAEGVIDTAVDKLANLAEIHPDNARRIVTDPDGEPLTVALKTLGISRAKFNKALKLFSTTPSAPLSAERDLQELQAMFDGLSFNKARTLMKYWDWAIEKSGPYARRSA